MALPLAGLADALRAAGLSVVELPGWKERTQRDGAFTPRGVMIHHDASAPGDSPGVPSMMANLANDGAQCWVNRYGVWHLVAAGRMWHAGSGTGFGVIPANDGNTYSVAVETDHTSGEEWPGVQYSSLVLGTSVLMAFLMANPLNAVCGHKEYRRSNPDPDGIDMDDFRSDVQRALENGATDMGMIVTGEWAPGEHAQHLVTFPTQRGDAFVGLSTGWSDAKIEALYFIATGKKYLGEVGAFTLKADDRKYFTLPKGCDQVSIQFSAVHPVAYSLELL